MLIIFAMLCFLPTLLCADAVPVACRFVSRKDPDANVVYVSRNYYDEERRRDSFLCGCFNWIAPKRRDPARLLLCKVRHGPSMYRCTLLASAASHLHRYVYRSTAQHASILWLFKGQHFCCRCGLLSTYALLKAHASLT
jgi:hypothetical protein